RRLSPSGGGQRCRCLSPPEDPRDHPIADDPAPAQLSGTAAGVPRQRPTWSRAVPLPRDLLSPEGQHESHLINLMRKLDMHERATRARHPIRQTLTTPLKAILL